MQGNSFGDEGTIALMSGLSSHKGLLWLCSFCSYAYCSRSEGSYFHAGKLTVLDLANNSIGARGASHVAEYIKKSKSLLLISLYMNDIGDEVGFEISCQKNDCYTRYFGAFEPISCHF